MTPVRTENQSVSRDFKIDFLRAVAILLIIMAHVKTVNNTGIIFQLRSFDVPLMCMLVGMTSYMSLTKRSEQYSSYLLKRFKRLIVPMWIFMTIYLILAVFNRLIFNVDFPAPAKIITSYIPIWGVGYVWIIRVYFIIAVIAPVIYKISVKVNNIYLKILILGVLLGIQQILCYTEKFFSGFILTVYQQILSVNFGYIIIALIGMWVVQQKSGHTFVMSLLLLAVSVALSFYYGIDTINSHKYPPDIYYISYGVTISLLLYLLLGKLTTFSRILGNKLIFWISASSLEMYYWHIFFAETLCRQFPNIHWSIRFVIVLIMTFLITYLQLRFFPGLYKGNFRKRS